MHTLATLRRNGWIYSAAIMFNRLVPAKLFRFRYFVILKLDPDSFGDSGQRNKRSNVEISVDSKTFWCTHPDQFRAVERVTFFDRLTSPEKCFACGVKVGDDTAGGIWGATHCFEESDLGLQLQFTPDQAWIFAALVDKQHREKGLYSRLLSTMVRELSSRGLCQLLVAVNPFNRASHRVHTKYAKGKVGAVAALRIGNFVLSIPFGKASCEYWYSLDAQRNPIRIMFR